MKILTLFISYLAMIVALYSCIKDCEQTAENLQGTWESVDYTLEIGEFYAKLCDKQGFCCESNYHYSPETKTLFFCGANVWHIEFDCKSITATTQNEEVLVFN